MSSQTSRSNSSRTKKGLSAKLTVAAHGNKTNLDDAFVAISKILYRRFRQEDVIDKRMLKAFADEIDSAPEQTHAEKAVIEKMLATASKIKLKKNRVSGTVQETGERARSRDAGAQC